MPAMLAGPLGGYKLAKHDMRERRRPLYTGDALLEVTAKFQLLYCRRPLYTIDQMDE